MIPNSVKLAKWTIRSFLNIRIRFIYFNVRIYNIEEFLSNLLNWWFCSLPNFIKKLFMSFAKFQVFLICVLIFLFQFYFLLFHYLYFLLNFIWTFDQFLILLLKVSQILFQLYDFYFIWIILLFDLQHSVLENLVRFL